MKFVISTQEFNYLISKCLNIVSQKAAVPILGNMLVEAKNGNLTLTATDMTVGVRCFAETQVIQEGTTALPARKLAQLVRELTATNIEVVTNPGHITEITAGSSRFKLHGMATDEFPALPDVTGATQFSIKQSELRDMLFRTSFAVSQEDNRYALTGLFLQLKGGKAYFTATDGKRLAKNNLPIELEPSFNGQYIIPLKAVNEIQNNLIDQDEKAIVYLMQDKIAVEANNCIIITKLLVGEYPDVTRIIPTNPSTIVALHRDELMTLLRQMSLFANDTHHSVKFTFTPGELELTANTMEVGEGKVSMPVNFKGEKLEIAFNPNFFIDILRHSKNETVTMGLMDPYNPGIITDQEGLGENPSPLYVLMPLRLTND